MCGVHCGTASCPRSQLRLRRRARWSMCPSDAWSLCKCRDLGRREDRQKTRLMWLVEEMGVEAYREEVGRRMGVQLRTGFHPEVRTMPNIDKKDSLPLYLLVVQPVCSLAFRHTSDWKRLARCAASP